MAEESVLDLDLRSEFEHDLSRELLERRVVVLARDITDYSAELACSALEVLASRAAAPIRLRISSSGGYIYPGLAVYDTIRSVESRGCEVIAEARGYAASMACIVMQAATVRLSTPRARFLIHEILGTGFPEERISDTEERMDELRAVNQVLAEIIANRCGKQAAEVLEFWRKREVWMSAREALEFGLIDKIIG